VTCKGKKIFHIRYITNVSQRTHQKWTTCALEPQFQEKFYIYISLLETRTRNERKGGRGREKV